MYKNIREQITDKERYAGILDADAMFGHLLESKRIICSNEQLYFYHQDEGRYISLPLQKEWHVLSYFFCEEICRSIRPHLIREIIQRLKYASDIQVEIDDFNAHSELINIRNGVLDYRELKLLPKDPKYRFTYQLNVSYLTYIYPNSTHYFTKFCNSSLDGDADKKELLLQIIGYLCTTLLKAKKCIILLGEPNSGKSLVIHLIEYMIGKEFISNIPLEDLGNRFSSAVLSSKFLNICGELSAQPLRNIETFKLVVGGDSLTGEFKGLPIFSFKNKCKLLYAGNMLPPIKNEDTSTAFVDRLTVLYFSHSIPKEARILDLDVKLQDEADAIFTYSIRNLQKLIENNFKFIEPEDSVNLLKDYSFQQTHITNFISEWCEIKEGLKIHSAKLYKAYKRFCEENATRPISQNLFSQKIGSIKDVNSGKFRINKSNPARGFYGISLKNDYVQDSET